MGISPRQLDAIIGRRRHNPGSGAHLLMLDPNRTVIEGRRHFEDLIDAARTGSRSALKQLGLERTPDVLEALWVIEPPTAVKVANKPEKVRRPWSLWRSGQPLPADPVAYISKAVRQRAKELAVQRGEPNQLSWLDRCELEVDHDAVRHLSRIKTWKRGHRLRSVVVGDEHDFDPRDGPGPPVPRSLDAFEAGRERDLRQERPLFHLG